MIDLSDLNNNQFHRWVVITTINPPTATIESLAKKGKHNFLSQFIQIFRRLVPGARV